MGNIRSQLVTIAAGALFFVSTTLMAIGFGPGGIVGGSIAAGIQSTIGNVVQGSIFAALQSMGASGMLSATSAAFGGTAVASAALASRETEGESNTNSNDDGGSGFCEYYDKQFFDSIDTLKDDGNSHFRLSPTAKI